MYVCSRDFNTVMDCSIWVVRIGLSAEWYADACYLAVSVFWLHIERYGVTYLADLVVKSRNRLKKPSRKKLPPFDLDSASDHDLPRRQEPWHEEALAEEATSLRL
ncbi:hypothetical protein BHE74_00020628 [Ensete ventricosum]|nr:hypothetical protein BHE74_00020628 [Ensete ventricosum]